MIRRTKGMKRYARQKERAFTDPLIKEEEMYQVKAALERLSMRRIADKLDRDYTIEQGEINQCT